MFPSPPFRFALVGVCLLALSAHSDFVIAGESDQLLLLSNGNVLHGIAETKGDLVTLQRDDGSELRLRRDQVVHVAATLQELYEHRASQRSFHTSTIHAEDARWCLRYGLIDQAQAELQCLKAIDPSNPLVERLQRQIESARQPQSTAPATDSFKPSLVLTKKPSTPEISSALPDSITRDSIIAFTTRVQPLLINRCGNAGCHRSGSETSWQLSHLGVNVRVSARMSQENIVGVLSHVDVNDPLSSALLRYMKTAHGNGRYEPAGHSAQAAEATLRGWLSQIGRYPQPYVEGDKSSVVAAAFVQPVAVPLPQPEPLAEGFAVGADGELTYEPGDADQTSRPTRLPAVANPFSADLFNRRYQVVQPQVEASGP